MLAIIIFIWMYCWWGFVLLISKSARCFSGDCEGITQPKLVELCFAIGVPRFVSCLLYFFSMSHTTQGLKKSVVAVPCTGTIEPKATFDVFSSSRTAQLKCSFAEVTSSSSPAFSIFLSLLFLVFEQWLKLQNDVCILVCLMLTCAERQKMEMFQ